MTPVENVTPADVKYTLIFKKLRIPSGACHNEFTRDKMTISLQKDSS